MAGLVGDADAGIRVGNLSRNYANTSKNYLATQQQYYNATVGTQQQDADELPVKVADSGLAEQIRRGDADAATDMTTLNKCAMIYPDGEFVWDRPTLGRGAGGAPTCVAVVEMRALNSSSGLEYTTVARGKLAAGDSVDCNISRFPSQTYLPALAKVEFPADAAPTREDVIQVMNEERKNNAGMKIAIAALTAGVVGNMVGKNDPGEDAVLGTSSNKLKTTAEGMLLGGGLMAASTYSGTVAGDTILHAGVNAAAGGVVGNMLAKGNEVLRIEKCTYEGRQTTCLWGTVTKTGDNVQDNAFYDAVDNTIYLCDNDGANCKAQYNYIVKSVGDIPIEKFQADEALYNGDKFAFKSDTDKTKLEQSVNGNIYKATVAQVEDTRSAVIVDFDDSVFGKKRSDFDKWKTTHAEDKVCGRNNKDEPVCNKADEFYKVENFSPTTVAASDGDVVDLSNKARLGSTLKGAGAGAAIGGFAGYQGAQSDIEARFVQATREYNASLENFYCGTGRKFLSFYNDKAIIPTMNE